jgi:hypothetical protein
LRPFDDDIETILLPGPDRPICQVPRKPGTPPLSRAAIGNVAASVASNVSGTSVSTRDLAAVNLSWAAILASAKNIRSDAIRLDTIAIP